MRDSRVTAAEKRRTEALARVLARVAQQFPELGAEQVMDAVFGRYVGSHALPAEPAYCEPHRADGPGVRYFRA